LPYGWERQSDSSGLIFFYKLVVQIFSIFEYDNHLWDCLLGGPH